MVQLSALSLGLSVVVLVTCLAGQEQQAEALPGVVSCAKDYLVGLVKSKIINKMDLSRSFNEAMKRVDERYAEAAAAGQLVGKDEAEQKAFRYKLVIEELRALRDRYESVQRKVDQKKEDSSRGEPSADDRLIEACLGVSGDVDKKNQAAAAEAAAADWSPERHQHDEDDEEDLRELTLWGELEDLERQAQGEDEMGLSLSPEVREKLKMRTQHVLNDLLNNEIRHLVLSVLRAYLTGGPMNGIVTAVSEGFKLTLVEQIVGGFMDIINSLMSRPLEVKPVEELKPTSFKPITADDLVAVPAA